MKCVDDYSFSIWCWMLVRYANKSFKMTDHLKWTLLMINHLPSDVECWFEMEIIHSKSPNTTKECCWELFLFHLMLNVYWKWKPFIQNDQIVQKDLADNYSSYNWYWMFIRSGEISFKITKYVNRMLLINIPLPCDA